MPVQKRASKRPRIASAPALPDVLRAIEVKRLQIGDDARTELAVVLVEQEVIQHPVGVALVFGDRVAETGGGHRAGACSMIAGSASTATGGRASMSILTPATVGATLAAE